jgi:putative cell wall-binding protein
MKKGIFLVYFILLLLPSVNAQGAVTILSSDHISDQTVATVWAEKIGAHLVLTTWGSLSDETLTDIIKSQPTIVYIVGGEIAVPGAESKLGSYDITLIRIGGATRIETSLGVAERFDAERAVVLDGYDLPSIEVAQTLGVAEGIPVIFTERGDTEIGIKLKGLGITKISLISNPAFEGIRNSIIGVGISIEELQEDTQSSIRKITEAAEKHINQTEQLVRFIKDGPTIAAARLLVDSKISLSKSISASTAGDYGEAFEKAVEAQELAAYAGIIYSGLYPGRIEKLVDKAELDLSAQGINSVKDELRNVGEPFGIGIPIPPIIDIDLYLVDIPGYTKVVERGSGLGFEYEVRGIYTRGVGQTVYVEIYEMISESEAIDWAEQIVFAPGLESRYWNITDFMGYPASSKNILIPVTDNMNLEVFQRVAVGNLGIFTKFTQSIRKADADKLLLPQDEVQLMVEEVTGEVIKEIEASK